MGEGELLYIFVEEDDEMGVAHGDEGALESAVINCDGIVTGTTTILGKLLWLLQDGGAHIYCDTFHFVLSIEMQLEDFDA